jgi:hypothetical protein
MSAPVQSPELKAHLRAIEESNRSYREWIAGETGDADDSRFNEIITLANIAASHGVSAGEAAWRRDENLLAGHLKHLREAVVLTLRVYNEIVAAGEKARPA